MSVSSWVQNRLHLKGLQAVEITALLYETMRLINVTGYVAHYVPYKAGISIVRI